MRRIALDLVLVVIAASSLIYGLTNTKVIEVPVIVKEPQVIEVPVIVRETDVRTIEVPKPLVIEKPIYQLQDFPNRTVLENFLAEDPTDKLPYTDRFTCMDFVLHVIDAAAQKGYRIVFFYWYKGPDKPAHAFCMAYTIQEAEWVVFEPQTDQILWSWTSWNIAN